MVENRCGRGVRSRVVGPLLHQDPITTVAVRLSWLGPSVGLEPSTDGLPRPSLRPVSSWHRADRGPALMSVFRTAIRQPG